MRSVCEDGARLYFTFVNILIMPLLIFDKVLKIISTIVNILSAALAAFGSSWNVSVPSDDGEGHA